MTGALLILAMICPGWGDRNAHAEPLQIEDLEQIGVRFEESGDDFGAYIFKVASYHLAHDSLTKLRLGFEISDICLRANRFDEAERMIHTIAQDFPDKDRFRNALSFRYAYTLSLTGEPARGVPYLSQLSDEPEFRDQAMFLRAHSELFENRPDASRDLLVQIDTLLFPRMDDVRSIIGAIDTGPKFTRRRKGVAVALSACLPGLGQAYCGHHFDALNSLLYNSLLGGAAYLSWKYDVLDRSSGDKRYAWPIISTVAWSVMYIANIWNAANAANRYNRYREMRHWNGVMEKFDLVISDRDYFLRVKLPIGP